MTTLGECCELNPKRPRNIDDELKVSFVPMPAISEDGKIDCSNIKTYKEVRKGFTYFAENDVIFAKITPCMENGKGAVAKGLSGGIGSGSTEFHVLRPIEGKSNPYWLYIITMFKSFRVGARKVMTGTGGQLRVPVGYLRDFPISLPPISLQDSFEGFVHQSDKSKFSCLKSQFIEMFGDPITNDKKLPVEPLSKHIELLGGFAFKSTGFVKEGIPVLRIGNINAGYFRPDDLPFWKYDKALDRYLLYPGDLAISLTGTVGKDDYGNVCRLGNDYPRYYLNQRNAKLILKDTVLPEFITALLKSRKIKDKIANAGVGVRQANISNKSILELKVPIPNLDGQNQFADFVRQSDKSK